MARKIPPNPPFSKGGIGEVVISNPLSPWERVRVRDWVRGFAIL